jgi:hypothetical protein
VICGPPPSAPAAPMIDPIAARLRHLERLGAAGHTTGYPLRRDSLWCGNLVPSEGSIATPSSNPNPARVGINAVQIPIPFPVQGLAEMQMIFACRQRSGFGNRCIGLYVTPGSDNLPGGNMDAEHTQSDVRRGRPYLDNLVSVGGPRCVDSVAVGGANGPSRGTRSARRHNTFESGD